MSIVFSLSRMQTLQAEHDLRCHRDIAALNHREQLRHFTLHFAKYARRLTSRGLIETPLKQTLVDALIIGLATANILDLDLTSHVAFELGDGISLDQEINTSWLLEEIVYHAGTMAKLSEAQDHMEQLPYRDAYVKAVIGIVKAIICFSEKNTINLAPLLGHRWQEIEFKRIA